MKLTAHLQPSRREHVERRLAPNLMAWLTTVRPDGRRGTAHHAPETPPADQVDAYLAKYRADRRDVRHPGHLRAALLRTADHHPATSVPLSLPKPQPESETR